MNWEIVKTFLLGVLSGGGIVAFILQEAIKDVFGRSKTKWKEKRQLAKDILEFIDEGQGLGYETNFSKGFKNVSRLVSLSLPYDPKISEEINQIFGQWTVHSYMNPEIMKVPSHEYANHLKFLSGHAQKLNSKVDSLRLKVTKWLK